MSATSHCTIPRASAMLQAPSGFTSHADGFVEAPIRGTPRRTEPPVARRLYHPKTEVPEVRVPASGAPREGDETDCQ